MKYLDKINSPLDLKNLSIDELNFLAEEIREFLLNSISKTGGHLSSNLGVIELTIALHYCFNSPEDKFIWDVGHQCYIHKILTGRKELLHTIRKKGGISGFPKINESPYDSYTVGHSSTSISAGLGFCVARDLNNQNHNVISIIGDGAMTGGLVYEAMNNLGMLNKKSIIILNDNQMSISNNVGSVSNYLNKLRTNPGYLEAKIDVQKFFNQVPAIGKNINHILEKTKDRIKYVLLPNLLFEQFDIKYIGPIDGHNIESLINAFESVKNINKPVLLHILTKKGNGYLPAEESPDSYHGVSKFDVKTGEFISKQTEETYSDVFGKFMVKEANKNKKLVAITAAMPSGTGLSFFSKVYPERMFDVGIAESHALIFSAGLSISGFIPVFAVYSTFLQRGYDQVLHDICIQNLHVVLAIDRAGITGDDGETHQGIYDLSFLSHIPNLTVIAPKDKLELEKMLDYAINKQDKPIAIRYPKGFALDNFYENKQEIESFMFEKIFSGEKIALVSVGTMTKTFFEVYHKLVEVGFNPTLINPRFISPISDELIQELKQYEYIFTLEDNILTGGFGSNLNSQLIKNRIFDKKIFNFSFPDEFIEQASISELHKKYGLDSESLFLSIKEILKDFNENAQRY